MLPVAVCLIRPDPHYRRDAFLKGLKRAGYYVCSDAVNGGLGNLLVIWNRYGAFADQASAWEARGGAVIVVENGYYGADDMGRSHYALAIGGHNGSGQSVPPSYDRLTSLGIDFKPWRTDGAHILICEQRGIGPPGTAQPAGWAVAVQRQMRSIKRPFKVRPHPANRAPMPPLSEDLLNCWAMVTWASNAATEALIAGIPVHYCGPHIVTEGAAIRGVETIENPQPGDRIAAFQRMAWAQWSVAEIEKGEPFEYLRDRSHQ